MNILKSILACGLACAAVSFAEENREKNICSELGTDVVNLKLAYVDEIKWYGNLDLTQADSVKTIRHEAVDGMPAIGTDFPYFIPYSVDAGCLVKKNVSYSYLQWNNSGKIWEVNSDNHDYATSIVDIHGNRTDMFDSTNAYNLLLIRAHNASLDDGSFGPEELFVSRTYELAFESWFATAKTTETKPVVINGENFTAVYSYYGYSMSQDSLKTAKKAIESVTVPDGVDKVELQIFHAVMKDPNRNVPEVESSSSSTPVVASSSSVVPVEASSSSATPVAASSSSVVSEISSSSVAPVASSSSESPVESSSSEGTLVMKSLQVAPAISGARQVRRLDGSVVKSGEVMKPGVYYVQGMDGLWKKQMVKTR